MTLPVTVAVPVRLAQRTIESTLRALLAQAEMEGFQVIAAVQADDPSLAVVQRVQHRQLRVLVASEPAGVPQLRRDAAMAADTEFVIITEDHCLFPAGWARRLVEACAGPEVAVSGGPVANARRTWLGWTQYFTRYTAFLPPGRAGRTGHLPGNNACYRREVLRARSALLRDGFWEAEFNQALIAEGERFEMVPEAVVEQRQHRGLLEYAALRYRHGRCYGGRRVEAAPGERVRLLLRSPLIPAILFARALRAVSGRPEYRARFLGAAPVFVVYILCWALGEMTGYAFGAGATSVETD